MYIVVSYVFLILQGWYGAFQHFVFHSQSKFWTLLKYHHGHSTPCWSSSHPGWTNKHQIQLLLYLSPKTRCFIPISERWITKRRFSRIVSATKLVTNDPGFHQQRLGKNTSKSFPAYLFRLPCMNPIHPNTASFDKLLTVNYSSASVLIDEIFLVDLWDVNMVAMSLVRTTAPVHEFWFPWVSALGGEKRRPLLLKSTKIVTPWVGIPKPWWRV